VPAPPNAKAKAIDYATPGISQDPIWGVVDGQQDRDVQMDLDPTTSAVLGTSGGEDPAGIIPDRLQVFRTRVARLWATKFQDDEQVFLADLVQAVNEGLDNTLLFSTSEATLACQAMTEANEVMLSDNIVYKI